MEKGGPPPFTTQLSVPPEEFPKLHPVLLHPPPCSTVQAPTGQQAPVFTRENPRRSRPPAGASANRPLPFRENHTKRNSSSPYPTAPRKSSQEVLSDVLCFGGPRWNQGKNSFPPTQTRLPFRKNRTLVSLFPKKTELSSVFSERPSLARAGRVCSDTKKVSNSSSLGGLVLSFHGVLPSPRSPYKRSLFQSRS